jgi:hypothetical protein
MTKRSFIFLALIHLVIIFKAGVVMAVSEPKFTIEKEAETYEIRSYATTVVAQTFVEADFDEAGNKAFRILADYIFGNNRQKTEISMTAPVAQKTASTKIAMTAPVSQIQGKSGFYIQFMMPDEYSLATLPEPNDSRVELLEVPARRVAVFKYSGSWSESRYKQKLAEFNAALEKDGLLKIGEPVFARFNSPLQIWFLRRNEIWQEIRP